MVNQKTCPAGSYVRVWIGALTGSYGVPPIDADGPICRLDHWNSVGQAYVFVTDLEGELPPSGNVGMYVWAPAILRVLGEAERAAAGAR